MKLVIIEPLGVEKERLLSMAEEALKGRDHLLRYKDNGYTGADPQGAGCGCDRGVESAFKWRSDPGL